MKRVALEIASVLALFALTGCVSNTQLDRENVTAVCIKGDEIMIVTPKDVKTINVNGVTIKVNKENVQ